MIDWDGIDLVVFDVDGTLYDAARLRRAMLVRLLAAAWQDRSLQALRVLRAFRQVREALGEALDPDFLTSQYTRTADRTGWDPQAVRALVMDWMEQRPLPLLPACRRPQVDTLFAALRAAGKTVAVWSDYPAADKLRALDLRAEVAVSAADAEVARLKPDPRGLLRILERTGVAPARTLMVGDRVDRDAEAARRAGVRALVLGRHLPAGVQGFRRFDDPVFAPLLAEPALVAA